MKVYPVEFFRQAPAAVAERVQMLPCKFNMGAVSFADRAEFTWNGAFSTSTNYWTATGANFSVNAGLGGVFGRRSAQLLLTSSSATLINDRITLPVAGPTNASMYVTSPVEVKVALQILGTESNGTTINDTATSGFITIQPNVTTRINAISTYSATTFRRIRILVGDGITSEIGKEISISQVQLSSGTRIGYDMPDENSSDALNPFSRTVSAISLSSNICTVTLNDTSSIGVGETIQIVGLTGSAEFLNGIHRVTEVPTGTTLRFRRLADNVSVSGLTGVTLWADLQPGNAKGQLTYDLTLGAGSNIAMDIPISGTFYTRVGTAGQPGATESTIFALSGAGGNAILNYNKSTQSLTFNTPGGNITSTPADPPTATVVATSLTANVATITTSAPHNFSSGGSVTISGLSSGSSVIFNGTYSILDTPTNNTFTFSKANIDVSQETGLNGTAVFSGINLNPNDIVWVGFSILRDNIILKFKVNNGSVSTNQTGSNSAPTITFNRLHLGHDHLTSKHWEGTIEQFLLYDVPISNSELDTMSSKTTPTNMVDDSRIAFATITEGQDNQFFMSYQRAKNLNYRWDGSWRDGDIRARISNNSTNNGKAFNTVDLVSAQRDTDWFKSGGTSSWPQQRVWSTVFVDTRNTSPFYYSTFYCSNPDYPDWSLWEVFDMLDIPGVPTSQYVVPRWSHGSDERDFYYLPELTSLRAYPNEQRTFGYIQ